MLVVQGHLYIIDVSQSVDLDHPSALVFLKEDCLHVTVSISYLYQTWKTCGIQYVCITVCRTSLKDEVSLS